MENITNSVKLSTKPSLRQSPKEIMPNLIGF